MRFEASAHVDLLTYGCPLRNLYARCFPAYFGLTALGCVGTLIRNPQAGGNNEGAPRWNVEARSRWRWRNLYRPTDPVGASVFVAYDLTSAPPADVDVQLRDPLNFEMDPGDTTYPPAN
jgi:hypothetical protein